MEELQCLQCTRQLPRSEFSTTQLKKPTGYSRCKRCVGLVHDAVAASRMGDAAAIAKKQKVENAVWQSRVTHGQMDGRMHKKAGSKTREPARRPSTAALTAGDDVMKDFNEAFSLVGPMATLESIKEKYLGTLHDELARAADEDTKISVRRLERTYMEHVAVMSKLVWLDSAATPWWRDEAQLTDFLSTLSLRDEAERVPFKLTPTESVKHRYEKGAMTDAPHMTDTHQLMFSLKEAKKLDEVFHVSRMPADRVVRHHTGTAVFCNGVLVGGRCRRTLSADIQRELAIVYNHLDVVRPYMQRGKGVANVCVNFVATGFKCDQNSRQCLIHQPCLQTRKNPNPGPDTVELTRQQWNKLRGLYLNWIHPIAMDSFGAVLQPVLHWIDVHGIELYAAQVTGVTFGELFWPRSHDDPDAWYTVLVPLDVGAGPDEGGDFAFGGAGWVLKCEPGDVLVYNGCELHGTSEFAISSASDSRVFAAFYCNAKTMEGRCVTDRMAPRQHVSLKEYGFLA